MCLNDAIDDGKAEAGAALKAGLERFENFLDELRRNASPGVAEANAPIILMLIEGDGEGATISHSAGGIAAKIPENLLELVAITFDDGLLLGEATLDFYASLAVLQQGQGV